MPATYLLCCLITYVSDFISLIKFNHFNYLLCGLHHRETMVVGEMHQLISKWHRKIEGQKCSYTLNIRFFSYNVT